MLYYDGEELLAESLVTRGKMRELVRDDEQQLATPGQFSQGATSASVSPDGKASCFYCGALTVLLN